MAAGASTATPPVLTPGSNHFNYEVWEAGGAEEATYQKELFIPRIDESGRPYSKMHIRKFARMSAVALVGTAVGTGLTYQDPLGTEVTFTPTGNYAAAAYSQNEKNTDNMPLDSELASELERVLAESSDQSALANVASLTQFRGDGVTDITASMLRNAFALLQNNTNGMVIAGQTTVYGILDVSQYGPLMSIPEFTNADVRGDAENPQVRGMWSKGGGIMMMLTTVTAQDGNGAHGCIWVPAAFVIGWNQRTVPYREQVELQHRIILSNHFGSTVKHDLRAVDLRTNATIPG